MVPELITRSQADALLWGVLVLGLVAGTVAGLIAKRKGQSPVLVGLLWGVPGVLGGILWRVYNAITDRLGLDSAVNLAVNAALFVIVGGDLWRSVGAIVGTGNSADKDRTGERGSRQ